MAELLIFVLVYANLLIFAWAPALAVVADLRPAAAFKASWRMFRRHLLDSCLLFLILTFGIPAIFYAVLLLALLVSIPGIVLLVAGLPTSAPLIAGGVAWISIAGGGTLLLGTGWLGAIEQGAYAIACRDLALHDGLIAIPGGGPPGGLPTAPLLPPPVASPSA